MTRSTTSDQVVELLHGIGPTPMLWDLAEAIDRSVRHRPFSQRNLAKLVEHFVRRNGRHQLIAAAEELQRFRASAAAQVLPLGLAVRQGIKLQFEPWDAGMDVGELLDLLAAMIDDHLSRWQRSTT